MSGSRRRPRAQNSPFRLSSPHPPHHSPLHPLSPLTSLPLMTYTAPTPGEATMESAVSAPEAFPPSSHPQPTPSLSAAEPERPSPTTLHSPTSTIHPDDPYIGRPASCHSEEHGHSSEEEVEVEGGEKVKKTKREIVLQDQTNLLPVRQVSLSTGPSFSSASLGGLRLDEERKEGEGRASRRSSSRRVEIGSRSILAGARHFRRSSIQLPETSRLMSSAPVTSRS